MSRCISARPLRCQARIALAVAIAAAAVAPAARADFREAEVERYTIDVTFQPERGSLEARATLTLRATGPLESIEFDLNPELTLLRVHDAAGNDLEFDRSQRPGSPRLLVRLGATAPAGQEFVLIFHYRGALRAGPLDYITKDGILLRDESRWYPAVDLSAFTQNAITIRLPAGWQALTAGEPQPAQSAPQGAAQRFVTLSPVSSRALVGYPAAQRACASVPAASEGEALRACFNGASADSAKRIAEAALGPLRFYSSLIGPEVAPGLEIVQGFPGQRGAIGYSAPGFLVVSEDVVKFHDYPSYAPEFLPHEVAHQWFPIEVTLASTEDGWLAESLAEYLAWRYLQEKSPEQAQVLVARAMRDALAPEPLRPLSLGLKLFALEGPDITHETLYQRGLLVWRTLETVIDRERVDRALRDYYRRHAGSAASIADFGKICEEISGRDLRWFFDYFINRTRIPTIELRRASASAPNEFAGEIVMNNVPAQFSVRVEMRVETLAGPVSHSVATRGAVTPFTVTTPGSVTRIVLDPDQRILRWTEAARRNRGQRALLGQIGGLERTRQFARAVEVCRRALALDPGDLARNEQQIHFTLGRLRYRQRNFTQAMAEFERVLELRALDPLASDFNRAWARIYRAWIERRRGRLEAARAEAQAGLAIHSSALEMQVVLPESSGQPTTAAGELHLLAQQRARR